MLLLGALLPDLIDTPIGLIFFETFGAVRLFTKGAAKECAAMGIRVNSVHPGIIDTAIWGKMDASMKEDGGTSILPPDESGANAPDAEAIATLFQVPMGHAGRPEEIADGILFLASEESSHMTGSELVIDGGFSC